MKLEERFWSKVEKTPTCWNWKSNLDQKGYGQFFPTRTKNVRAHKFAYQLAKGAVPQGLTIDHLCRNRACVNPDHMEAVTSRENTLRGQGPTAILARKTHCPRGHPLSGDNLVVNQLKRGHRICRTCHNAWFREYMKRVRLANG